MGRFKALLGICRKARRRPGLGQPRLLAGQPLMLAGLLLAGCGDRLTPDQEMIDNFRNNKPAFEELVNAYLASGGRNGQWDRLPRVIELKRQTGVERIIDGPDYWFNDPYSLEAAQKLREIDENKSWDHYHGRKPAIVRMPVEKGYGHYTLIAGNSWKDYFYFPADPSIKNGRIVPPRELDGSTYPGTRVLDSLDSAPGGRSDCYFRKIEPRWFIQRCDIR